MELIPLIKTYKKEIISDIPLTEENILEKIGENRLLYILDIDGIERDKPNYCNYQKLSKSFDLWIDCGPRNLGDVVDAFMAGATRITIRREFYGQLDINSIREITENKIYTHLNLESERKKVDDDLFFQVSDGLVTFNDKEKIELEYKYSDFLKYQSSKNKVFSYEYDPLNVSFWKDYNIDNLLVDIQLIKEFEKYGI